MSADPSVRAQIAALLKPELPPDWRIVTSEVGIDKISAPVVRLSAQSFRRHPSAPFGKRLVEFVCRITVPGLELADAEDRLEVATDKLLWAIESAGGSFHWSEATKVQDSNKNLGYEITLTATTDKPIKE